MIKEEFVTISWNGRNREYLESKGYKFTKHNDKIEINPNDLSKGSHIQITAICDLCGNEKVMEYRVYLHCHNKEGYYCCKKCSIIKQREVCVKKYGVPNVFQTEWAKEKSKQTCLSRYGTEYITQNEEWKNKYAYGENNNFYIDGRYKNTAERNNVENKKWRKQVLKKFNNKCFICKSNERLIAHHIDGYNLFPNKQYDIENGVCLCYNCHKEFHDTYGYGNNTEYQFLSWINKKQENN